LPPRRNNFDFSRAVKKSNFLFSAGKQLLRSPLTFLAGWIRVVSVLTVSFVSWTLYRVPRRYLSRRLGVLPGAFRRFFIGLAGRVRAGASAVLQGRRAFAGRVVPRSAACGRGAGIWLWLRVESAIAVGDRFLVRTAGKLDEWSEPVLVAVRWACLRAGVPVLAGCRSAGCRLSGWAARYGRALGERYRSCRFASLPPVYQLISAVVALAMVLVPYELVWGKNALVVTAGGQVIGQVASQDEVWVALQELEEDNAHLYGLPVAPIDKIDLVPIHSDSQLIAGDGLRSALARHVRFGVSGAGISVNGQVKVVLLDQAVAEKTLQDFTARYQANGASVRFEEAVAVVPVTVPAPQVVSEQDALALLGGSVVKPATYTVKNGDTLWQLAQTLHIGVSTLASDNPGMDINHLGIGEVINLDRVSQLVNVLATYQATIDEAVPYQVQWQKDSNLGYGQTELAQSGRPGREQVLALVTEENGSEIKRQVLQRQVLAAPVPEIERTGGDIQIASRGGDYHGGRLIWPASGSITSPFGMRTIFGRREFHAGIDIGAGYGQPVVAAAPGVVTFTGWESGYGRTVMVSHGNGLSTLYAHLSSIVVNQGQSVRQGQELGRVGETGDATGPHVHFEVHENGTPVNPVYFL